MIIKTRNNFVNLINERNFINCFEIGTFKGEFAKHLLENCKNIHLTCVDPWTGIGISQRKLENFIGNEVYEKLYLDFSLNFPRRFSFLRMLSEEACKLIPDEFIDFIYIDADHSYESVKKDLINWFPKVKIGGVIAGHDYINRKRRQVKIAVDEFFKDKEFNLTKERVCKSWWFEKGV